MDFGTGRELYDLADGADGPVAGTPLYLAPEVLAGGAATPQSDVYSIGVVLFRLLTNTYPVTGGNLADLRRAHQDADDAVLRVDRAEIPTRLRTVLARVLDPHPDRRFAGADALAAALTAADRAPSRRRMIVVLAAAGALIATGGACWNFGLRERLSPALVAMGLLAKAPTIAVLPFRNTGSDPGNDQFIDGLTSEVIRNLANIDGLQVVSQESSFYFRDRADRIDAGKQLHADFVLEATVQRVANRIRINPRLVRVSDQVVVWSDQPYDRTIDDIFAIQDDISLQIVNKLRLTLGQGQRRYQTNIPAYDLYLRALAVVARRGNDNAQEAIKLFEQVIKMDDAFAPAHAGLAEAYGAWSWQMTGLPPEAGLAVMRPAAERALYLDPLLPEAYAAMGLVYSRELDWVNARKSFEHAMRLRPYLSQIPARYSATTLLALGEARKAERLLAAAAARDPLSLEVRRELGIAQYYGGHYEQAVASLQHVGDSDPRYGVALMLARALTKAGRPDEAIRVWESNRGNWERWVAPAYVMAGRWDDVERLKEAHKSEEPHRQLLIYAAIGDKERAFAVLGAAIDSIPHRMPFILASPDMDLLRGDPRLKHFRARLNLR
jgi:TolB-like protein